MDNIKNKISILFNNLGCPFVGYISRADDMPAHVRSALTQTHLSIPLMSGRVTLGQWQGIFLYEHRHIASQRQVILHLMGE